MSFLPELLNPIVEGLVVIEAGETDIELHLKATATRLNAGVSNGTPQSPDLLQANDELRITINFGSSDPVSYYSRQGTWQAFITAISEEAGFHPNEVIQIESVVQKDRSARGISVYDLHLFSTTIRSLSISQGLSVFDRVLADRDFRCFHVKNLTSAFSTSALSFVPASTVCVAKDTGTRKKRLDSSKSVSHFEKDGGCRLLPDDFAFIEGTCQSVDLLTAFQTFELTLSLGQLVDISSLRDNEFSYRLNGFKTLTGALDVKASPPKDNGQYARINHWVYAGGVIVDKIGLARNIISLHLESSEVLDLKGHPYDAILSGYKIYEKQNIKTYIDLRNKVTEQLIDFNNRATKIVQDFASGFQRGALALLSFYTTTLVIKVLSKGDVEHLFNTDVTILSISFLAASGLYYYVCKWEVKQQRTRFIAGYDQMKARQADILDGEDVKRILNNDAEHVSNISYIDGKVRVYRNLWIGLILILLGATLILFSVFCIDVLSQTPLVRFLLNQ